MNRESNRMEWNGTKRNDKRTKRPKKNGQSFVVYFEEEGEGGIIIPIAVVLCTVSIVNLTAFKHLVCQLWR